MKSSLHRLSKSDYQLFSEKIMELGNSFLAGMILAQIFFQDFDKRIAVLGLILFAFMYFFAYFVLLSSR